jgi:hypothetical protein
MNAAVFRLEEWVSGDHDLTQLHALRYTVLVDEMGKYADRADHERRLLIDEEDATSWHFVALTEVGEIAAANRLSWGGAGFSPRQIEQYDLKPWLDAGLGEFICVGERTIVAPAHRGSTAVHELSATTPQAFDDNDIRIVFGACEPHLLTLYLSVGQFPYAERNINSEEAGYLIPMVMFMPDAEALRGEGTAGLDPDGRRALPAPVKDALEGTTTVMSTATSAPADYLRSVRDALDQLADANIGAFDGFDDDEIERCVARSNMIECEVGDRLLKAGGTGRNIFVVLNGTLEVRVDGRVVGLLSAGDAFGETAFLLNMARSADVYAATPGPLVLSLSDGALRKMIAEDPTVAAKFLLNLSKMLCGRLIKAN